MQPSPRTATVISPLNNEFIWSLKHGKTVNDDSIESIDVPVAADVGLQRSTICLEEHKHATLEFFVPFYTGKSAPNKIMVQSRRRHKSQVAEVTRAIKLVT